MPRCNQREHNRQNEQRVYSIYGSDNSSIFDYNQALSCSVEIIKEANGSIGKEDVLPSYQDALRMKPHG